MKRIPFIFTKKFHLEQLVFKIKRLEDEIKNATNFIKNIEHGNLDAEFLGLSATSEVEASTLAGSLLSMRNQMVIISNEEKQRNWTTAGLAKFVEILRSNNQDINTLSDRILSNLVKYMGANQGYLFVLNDSQIEEKRLELIACYAYDRKKFVSTTVALGEGLVGQCFLEKETIHISDLPKDYIKITSGIGESLPCNLVLIPLKISEEVYGIIEIATFNPIKKYEIEFLEKLGESIASAIAGARTNERTKKLLVDSQLLAEELRAQEEEVRQNMEELSATQEELNRKGSEMEDRIAAINESGIASIEFDPLGNILRANASFLDLLGYAEYEVVGKHHRIFVEASMAESVEHKKFWEDLGKGIQKPGEFKRINKKGEAVYIKGSYSIIRDRSGGLVKILNLVTDITALKVQLAQLAEQEEEMRQNIEELSATQEELERKSVIAKEKEIELQELMIEMKVNEEDMQKVEKKYRQLTMDHQKLLKSIEDNTKN